MTFKPHDYQKEALAHLYKERRAALWMPMGGGKTVTTLTALEALSVVEDVYPVLVLAPLRVARSTWPDEVKKWPHLSHLRVSVITGTPKQRQAALDTPADIYTTNYDNLVWLREALGDAWPFITVVADECFVAETLVDTPSGPKRIDTIETGDIVETHAGPRPVSFVHKRFTNALNLVCLKLSSGDQIHVTAEHPFFTDLGWLPARACGGRRLYGRNCLSDLSDALPKKPHDRAPSGAEREDAVLRSKLPHQGNFCKTPGTSRASEKYDADAEQGADGLLELWEAMVRRPSGEKIGSDEGPDVASVSRRERNRYVPDGSAYRADNPRGFFLELCNTVGRFWAGLSVELQVGFCRSEEDGVFGGGRPFAPYKTRSGARCKEEQEVVVVGVESMPDRQRDGVVPVFNLEVEGAPTYFAAGRLVHNCTRLKSFRLRQGGSRARALGQVAHTHVTRFIGLTGTPAPNGVKDLWGQVWFLDKGERLGRTFSAFSERWFRKGYDGYSLVPYDHTQEEVQERLKDICLTVRGLPVDEPITTPLYIDLPPAARRAYDEMEEEMYTVIGAEGVEAANAAVRTQKCLQLANGALYTDEYGNWEAVHDAKLEALDSVIEEANGAPVLVAYNFKHDLARLRKRYPKGRVLDADPDTIKRWNRGEIELLFAHPASAGHGLNLADGGNILAFYGVNWNLEEHMQIIERIGPMRQKQAGYDRPVLVYPILARDTVDDLVMDRLTSKKSVQEILLEALKRRKK